MRNSVVESDLEYITKADLPWEWFRDKTVLISGAAGFLAAYIVETLLYLNETKQLNVKVLGLVLSVEDAWKKFSHHKENKNLVLIQQDICDKIEVVENIDCIIHAASFASPKIFSQNLPGTINPNIIGTKNLLDLAVKKNVECFLFFSTGGVYGYVGPESYPIKENCFGALDPMDIASCYIESKRMGENMCAAWMHQYGVPVKIVRPGINYGPGIKLDDGRSFADFISNIVNRQNIEIYSDGRAIRNFCYVADSTLGFFTVLLNGTVGEAYNIASDQEISILNLAKLLTEKAFPELKLKVIMKNNTSKNYLRANFSRTTLDISKAKALGFKLNFSLEEGFRRTVKSFEENKNVDRKKREIFE